MTRQGRWLPVVALAVAALALAGCKGEERVCDPGATQHCACMGGTFGVQECEESGDRWGACDCGGEDATTDGDADAAMDPDVDPEMVHDGEMEGPCPRDEDGDGQEPIECGGTDCDDSDSTAYVGATEVCDDIDQDCDWTNLDAADADDDGDGYLDAACGGSDCDDEDATRYPGAYEGEFEIACDLVDKDCDGDTAEVIDDDCDGWIDAECDGVITDPGSYEGLGDCDDENGSVFPGAAEGCDGVIDNDCDGDSTDVDSDVDGDGYSPVSCGGGDCDDDDAATHPGATEACDMIDQDCDGSILDAPGIDDDGDGAPDEACGGTDCDDTVASVHGAFNLDAEWMDDPAIVAGHELCDTIDQDCDGLILDATGADDDSDTYMDQGCGGTDCNDLSPYVHPGAAEDSCDSIDNDCDGDAIDGVADQDGDGYMNGDCVGGTDCDDFRADVYPGAAEICGDSIDQDCDGTADDGC